MHRFALLTLFAFSAAAQVGQPLPAWTRGTLDIHQISTGKGNAAFLRLPDGTTLLVDAGAAPLDNALASQKPNTSKTPGAWVADYVAKAMAPESPRLDYALLTHFHGDHMGGIGDVAAVVPIATLIDRGTSVLPPNNDNLWKTYTAFVEAQASRGMARESIRVGRADQIVLKRDRASFSSFEVRNVAANGLVWTGSGDATVNVFPPLDGIAIAEDRPNENMCSIGIRIRYGKFDFFTGGDMPGAPDAGGPEWHSIETPVAKAIGPTDVHVVNHHGSISPASPFFLATLRSPVMILPAWSPTHPSQDALKRMMTQRLYPGPHDIFAVTMREPAKLSIGPRASQLKATHGHIVVRVAEGGSEFRVFVLDDESEARTVTAIFGPYVTQ